MASTRAIETRLNEVVFCFCFIPLLLYVDDMQHSTTPCTYLCSQSSPRLFLLATERHSGHWSSHAELAQQRQANRGLRRSGLDGHLQLLQDYGNYSNPSSCSYMTRTRVGTNCVHGIHSHFQAQKYMYLQIQILLLAFSPGSWRWLCKR